VVVVVVTTGAIRRAKLQSNRQRPDQQTNTELSTGPMPFLTSNQWCPSTGETELQKAYRPTPAQMFHQVLHQPFNTRSTIFTYSLAGGPPLHRPLTTSFVSKDLVL